MIKFLKMIKKITPEVDLQKKKVTQNPLNVDLVYYN